MLEARNIAVVRSGRTILQQVSMAIKPGEMLVICGPNGAGKSTLLSVLAGDMTPAEGQALIDGDSIHELDPALLAQRRAVLEQNPIMAAAFNVSAVVDLGADCAERRVKNTVEFRQRALQAADVAHLADKRIDRLSGGERARTHLARIFAQLYAGQTCGGGRYLLLDEPTASLDLSHQIGTLRAVRRLVEEGVGVVVVLHDLNLAAAFADRILLMQTGTVIADGPVEQVFTTERLSQVYDTRIATSRDNQGSLRIMPNYHAHPGNNPINHSPLEGEQQCTSP